MFRKIEHRVEHVCMNQQSLVSLLKKKKYYGACIKSFTQVYTVKEAKQCFLGNYKGLKLQVIYLRALLIHRKDRLEYRNRKYSYDVMIYFLYLICLKGMEHGKNEGIPLG
jgi:hypothetical protein